MGDRAVEIKYTPEAWALLDKNDAWAIGPALAQLEGTWELTKEHIRDAGLGTASMIKLRDCISAREKADVTSDIVDALVALDPELGDLAGALEFTRALAPNLDEGPFGQAHRVFGAGTGAHGEMARPARKDQSWMAVCSGYIADGVIRGLFGFMPSIEADGAALALKQPDVPRGFEGTLRHVRFRGALWTLTAGQHGVRATRE